MNGLLDRIRGFLTSSVRRQLIIGIAAVHAVLMTIFVLDLVLRQQSFLEEQNNAQALSLANTVSANSVSWVLANDVIGLEEIIFSISDYPQLKYAMVIDPYGKVLGHSNPALTGMYVADEVSLQLIDAGLRPMVLIENQQLVDVISPVIANEQLIGWARVALSRGEISQGLRIITRDGIIYTLIAILVGTLFAVLMARGIAGGLLQLTAVTSKVKSGDYGHRVSMKRSDEIGRLGSNFNTMLDALDQQRAKTRAAENALREVNEELEERVRQRTEELTKANKSLVEEIEDRQKFENALRDSEQKFRRIINESSDGISIVNEQGSIITWNKAMAEMTGIASEKAYGQNIWDNHFQLLPKEQRNDQRYEEIKKRTLDMLKTGKLVWGDQLLELQMEKADGSIIYVQGRFSSIKTSSGYLIVNITRDITAIKKAEEDIHRYADELREANEQKDKFFSIIAHDLRSPFFGFLGLSKILATSKDKLSEERLQRLSQQLYDQSRKIYTLIENLLQWSRIQTGRIEYQPEPLNLAAVVKAVISPLQQNIDNKSQTVAIRMDEELMITADQFMLETILRNLLSNAIKFSHTKGEIIFTAAKNNGAVEIKVIDNGVGIAEEDQQKLFAIDKHVSTVGTENEKGSGLGLILVKEFVEMHNGSLQVTSKLNEGTTISLIIPENPTQS